MKTAAVIFTKSWKRAIRRFTAAAVVNAVLLNPAAALALEIIPVTGFHIRSERLEYDKVLVSRPHQTDRKILDFLVLNRIRTLQDYSRWLSDNIEYREDAFPDPWIYPQEMLAGRHGDCEDFALLTMHVLQVLGFKPKVLALVRVDKSGQVTRSHAICVIPFKNGYLWFDNSELKEAGSGNLQDLAQELMFQFNYTQTAELDFQTMSWATLYERA